MRDAHLAAFPGGDGADRDDAGVRVGSRQQPFSVPTELQELQLEDRSCSDGMFGLQTTWEDFVGHAGLEWWTVTSCASTQSVCAGTLFRYPVGRRKCS